MASNSVISPEVDAYYGVFVSSSLNCTRKVAYVVGPVRGFDLHVFMSRFGDPDSLVDVNLYR